MLIHESGWMGQRELACPNSAPTSSFMIQHHPRLDSWEGDVAVVYWKVTSLTRYLLQQATHFECLRLRQGFWDRLGNLLDTPSPLQNAFPATAVGSCIGCVVGDPQAGVLGNFNVHV